MTSTNKIPPPPSIAVVVPVFRSESTLPAVLLALNQQDQDVKHIFIIDDYPPKNPCDEVIAEFKRVSRHPVTYIKRDQNRGLAAAYNDALRQADSDLLITLQADVVIPSADGITRLIEPFRSDPLIVLSCALQETPWDIWYKYSFWQKCLFSRQVGRVLSGQNGRFCCFSTHALHKVGLFDEATFRTAGEDGDIIIKLRQIGKIVDVPLVVKHLHQMDWHFSLRRYIQKENQLAEAQGAFFARHARHLSWRERCRNLARPILALSLAVPKFNIAAVGIIALYSIAITGNVFKLTKDVRLTVLPFVNAYILFSFTYFFLKGLITKRQRL